MPLFVNNDHRVEITGLKNSDGDVISGATVTATLFERDRATAVAGVSWPITLADEGSGTYGATLPDEVGITAGRSYWLKVEAVSGGVQAQWWQRERARHRGFGD